MDIKTISNFRPKNKEALENIKDLTLIVKKFIKENILFLPLSIEWLFIKKNIKVNPG